MGQAKKYMMLLEELEGTAGALLVRTGALKRCPNHGVLIDNGDPDAVKRAYAIGTNMVKQGEVDADREDFMEAIKRAAANAADECGYCAKNMDD